MMSIKQDIQCIRDLAAVIKFPSGRKHMSTGCKPGAGQVWRTLSKPPFPEDLPASCYNEEPYLVLILDDEPTEMAGHSVFQVMPIHRDCAQAGPDDILLPRDVFGYRVVICAAASIPVFQESLDHCVGMLPKSLWQLISDFRDWLDGLSDIRPKGVMAGVPYLDEQDLRWRYKEAMGASLAYLQTPVISWMERSGLLVADASSEQNRSEGPLGLIIPFPFQVASAGTALAADSSLSAQRSLVSRTYQADDLDVMIQVSEAEDARYFSLEVLHDPENLLDGAALLSEEGLGMGHIQDGMAYLAIPFGRGFLIQIATGRKMSFHEVAPCQGRGGGASDELDS